MGERYFDPQRPGNAIYIEEGHPAAVNLATREVVELKPNNSAAIARGERQVAGYAQQLDQRYPGDPFTYRVQTYDRP